MEDPGEGYSHVYAIHMIQGIATKIGRFFHKISLDMGLLFRGKPLDMDPFF